MVAPFDADARFHEPTVAQVVLVGLPPKEERGPWIVWNLAGSGVVIPERLRVCVPRGELHPLRLGDPRRSGEVNS